MLPGTAPRASLFPLFQIHSWVSCKHLKQACTGESKGIQDWVEKADPAPAQSSWVNSVDLVVDTMNTGRIGAQRETTLMLEV